MDQTTILVDFENVQPSAADIALVRGEHVRLWIFRGPGQKKYSADVAEAWQPLGDRVQFIHCTKAGRNALDMHIAFQLGRLLAETRAARFVVVSKDTDYDPLLQYIRSLGVEAMRSPSIKAALGAAEKPAAKPAKTRAAAAAPVKPEAPKKAAAKRVVPARKTRSAPQKAEPPKPAQPKKAVRAAQVRAAQPAAATKSAPDLVDKAVKHLREHPKSRPAKRKALEKNIESVLRKKIDPKDVPALVDALQARGVISIAGNKVAYPLWGESAA